MAATPKPVRKMVKQTMAETKREHEKTAKKMSSPTKEKFFNKNTIRQYAKESGKVVKELGMMRKKAK